MSCGCGPPKLPTMNLFCNVWWGVPGPFVPPFGPPNLVGIPCQLEFPQHSFIPANVPAWNMYIKLPKLTNVMAPRNVPPGYDMIECPAGSARYYLTVMVDDVGKGFTNEYRMAVCTQVHPFPQPTP